MKKPKIILDVIIKFLENSILEILLAKDVFLIDFLKKWRLLISKHGLKNCYLGPIKYH